MEESLNNPHSEPADNSAALVRSISGASASSSCPNLAELGANRRLTAVDDRLQPVNETSIVLTSKVVGNKKATIRQHYYPEGGWGWVVAVAASISLLLANGLQLALASMPQWPVQQRNNARIEVLTPLHQQGSLSAISLCVSLAVSPVAVAWCRRKSTRLTAVLGGLMTALSLLFASFASQYHQIALSYGLLLGLGVGLTRDTASLIIGQYFKRKRDVVEIAFVGSTGLGFSLMSVAVNSAFNALGWRLALQALTVVVLLTFILGSCYRSASLYHPQRRAILHLKNQRKKVKDKNKRAEDRPPFFDFTSLKSQTVQVILASTFLVGIGLYNPLIYSCNMNVDGRSPSSHSPWLQVYTGLAWSLGCVIAGLLVVFEPSECRIGRQYLCQVTSLLTGLTVVLHTVASSSTDVVPTDRQGLTQSILFAWIYGFGLGSYYYTLKVFVYQRARARNFARIWSFVQFSQGIGAGGGIALAGYMKTSYGGVVTSYVSGSCILTGCLALFLLNARSFWMSRPRSHKHKHRRKRASSSVDTACLQSPNGNISHSGVAPQEELSSKDGGIEACPPSYKARFYGGSLAEEQTGLPGVEPFMETSFILAELGDTPCADAVDADELTCVSEDGIVALEIPEHLLEDLDFMADCITSCDKVENYLMLSEYENNLSQECAAPSSKSRRWSLFKQFSRRGKYFKGAPTPTRRKQTT